MQGWGGTRHIWRGVRSTAECWLRWLCGEHDEADSHLPTMQIWAVPESRKNDAKTSHHTTRNYPAGSMDTDHCSWEIPVLVFALLPNKTKATYRRFFSILKSAVNDRQSVLTPESWMIDFETAARNAWKETFPKTTIRGCFFDFTQRVWRKVAWRPNFGIMTVFINLCDELPSSLLYQVTELRMLGGQWWQHRCSRAF